MKKASFYGVTVMVVEGSRRTVSGGVVVDVKKVPGGEWPWTVTTFTVNEACLDIATVNEWDNSGERAEMKRLDEAE